MSIDTAARVDGATGASMVGAKAVDAAMIDAMTTVS
jgi:hypothetical protein